MELLILLKDFLKNIVILENIRFYKQEEEPSPVFAKYLSSLGEIFVNDALQ